MLTVDAAFERIATTLRQMGYVFVREERLAEALGARFSVFKSPNMSVRLLWTGKARILALEVEVDGEWVEFARRTVGEGGLDEAAVETLIHAVRNEVDETSTDGP